MLPKATESTEKRGFSFGDRKNFSQVKIFFCLSVINKDNKTSPAKADKAFADIFLTKEDICPGRLKSTILRNHIQKNWTDLRQDDMKFHTFSSPLSYKFSFFGSSFHS